MGYYQGIFRPRNPEKYVGDPTQIIYRSSWELKVMNSLDTDPNVVYWASEEHRVPYVSPLDNRRHTYFPDFVVKKRINGKEQVWMLEVKPAAKLSPPVLSKKGKRAKQRYLNEVADYARNMAKWTAAKEYCKKAGMKFQVLTEKDLGIG